MAARQTAPARRKKSPGLLGWAGRLLLLALTAFLIIQAWFFVQVWQLREHNPDTTAFMRAYLNSPEGQFRQQTGTGPVINQQWIPYEQISDHAKRAVVAAEDDRFMMHGGFDWEGIQQAFERNRQAGRVVAGGSGISQQLAKNLFLPGSRSWWRKGQETLITLMLEQTLDKERILELYLNLVEWGEGLYGIEAAAWHYHGIPAAALGKDQSARLAAMLPNPRFYEQNRNAQSLERRSRAILSRMDRSLIP